MALILEDGTAPAGANSYATEAIADAYFDDRDNTDWGDYAGSNDKEAALIRATAALDNSYRSRYPGYRTLGRQQSLEWPRTAAYDYEGVVVNTNEVPIEVIQSTCEFAIRELLSPGSTNPDQDRGGDIRSIRAGSVAIDYGATASVNTTFQTVDGIMARILGAAIAPWSANSVRG